MNVTCTGCPAKYAVPDEKVRGKKVRITCKHCGTNIVVDGTTVGDSGESVSPKPVTQSVSQPAPVAQSVAPAPTSVQDFNSALPKPVAESKPRTVAEVAFIVGFPDDRQETHTVSEIVDMYDAGKIDDEALVWKDGMPDWLSPFDVPELAAALRAKGVARRTTGSPGFAAVAEDEATLIVRSPMEELQKELAAAAASASAAVPPSPTPAAGTPPPAVADEKPAAESMFGKPAAAARRVEKRPGGVDLFGGVAAAGSEGDVSLDLSSSEEPAHKLTGARNESSVLFSLDALTKPDPKAKAKKATERENEREASAALFGESAPDSLMNLGGGGLSALAAPDFTKPVTAIPQPVGPSLPLEVPNVPPNKGRGGLVLFITFVAIAAVAGGAFVMMKKQNASDAVALAPSAVTPVEAATPSATETAEAPSAPAAGTSSAAAADSSASASPSASVASAVATKPTAPATPGAAAASPAAATPVTGGAAKPEPSEPTATVKKTDAVEPPAEGAAFDKNAAVAALGAAAASAGSCKKPDGPVGAGKVSVTFAPSGRATATNVAGELAGTEVGGCVARLFRSAKVPPFSGEPVTVSKSFSIQ